MDIDIIVVPYDSGQRGVRMGAGPEALITAGFPDRLERAGHRVTCIPVDLPDKKFRSEIRTAFDLAATVAEQVRKARAVGAFPLVLSGNCSIAIGVIGGIGPGSTVLWCDAHADFNTPETSISGFLDGMALATMTGRCWASIAAQVPGFVPVPESNVLLVGARDLDPLERVAVEECGIELVSSTSLGADLAIAIRSRLAHSSVVYFHLDVDVLDPSEGRANGFAADGGATAAMLQSFCKSLGPPAAATISAYDPAWDVDGRICEAVFCAVEAMLSQTREVERQAGRVEK